MSSQDGRRGSAVWNLNGQVLSHQCCWQDAYHQYCGVRPVAKTLLACMSLWRCHTAGYLYLTKRLFGAVCVCAGHGTTPPTHLVCLRLWRLLRALTPLPTTPAPLPHERPNAESATPCARRTRRAAGRRSGSRRNRTRVGAERRGLAYSMRLPCVVMCGSRCLQPRMHRTRTTLTRTHVPPHTRRHSGPHSLASANDAVVGFSYDECTHATFAYTQV